jgi:hypothetical protein
MFAEARRRRFLRKKVEEARKLEAPYLNWGQPDFDSASEEFLQARRRVLTAEYHLDLFETEVLTALARKYGVEEPTGADSWNDDSEAVSPDDVTGLRVMGKRGSELAFGSSRERTGNSGSPSLPLSLGSAAPSSASSPL